MNSNQTKLKAQVLLKVAKLLLRQGEHLAWWTVLVEKLLSTAEFGLSSVFKGSPERTSRTISHAVSTKLATGKIPCWKGHPSGIPGGIGNP